MPHLSDADRANLTDDEIRHAVETQAARAGLDVDAWLRLEAVRERLLDYIACEGMEWREP